MYISDAGDSNTSLPANGVSVPPPPPPKYIKQSEARNNSMVCTQSLVRSYPDSTKYKSFPTTHGCMLILSHATVHSQHENAYIKANLFFDTIVPGW